MAACVSRRDFVRTGLAAAGALAAAASALPRAAWAAHGAPAEAPAEAAPKMHVGLVTYLVGAKMDLDTLIDVCEKSGMEGVELRSTHAHGVEPSLDAAGRAKVKERFARTKVRCYALGSACEYHSPKPEEVKKNIDLTKEFVKLAADLGCWGVKVRPNGLPKGVDEDATLRQIAAAVRECAEFAGERGLTVMVECHGGETQRPDRMAKIMEYCKHPAAALCWNCNGIDVQDGSIAKYFKMCEPWIRHVHIQTITGGGYPWKELFDLLKAARFSHYTMIETDSKGADPVAFLRAQRAAWEQLTA
ncbi:MAG: sugar phosphate isomerase/epimerase [Planctomycetes bacterium]|nr:sugar phosphate isomerase/epimerase [Planctomycetota bacterium]